MKQNITEVMLKYTAARNRRIALGYFEKISFELTQHPGYINRARQFLRYVETNGLYDNRSDNYGKELTGPAKAERLAQIEEQIAQGTQFIKELETARAYLIEKWGFTDASN